MADQPRLLAFPRELRNAIYAYLYQELHFIWPEQFTATSRLLISASKAPLRSILLTCRRFHDEYLESCVFKRLSVSLFISANGCRTGRIYWMRSWAVPAKRRALALLSRAQNVTLYLFSFGTPKGKFIDNANYLIVTIQSLLSSTCLQLETFKVACQQASGSTCISGTIPPSALREESFLPYMWPPSFLGLPLQQRVAGYRLHVHRFSVDATNGIIHNLHAHIISNVAYTYTRSTDKNAVAKFWTPEALIKELRAPAWVHQNLWGHGQVDRRLLEDGNEEGEDRHPEKHEYDHRWGRAQLRYLGQNMREWREKRGDRATKWEEPDTAEDIYNFSNLEDPNYVIWNASTP